MKQSYKIEINGVVLLETNDIKEFNEYVELYKHRRTGRTTRLLFQAMGSDSDNVFILSENYKMNILLMTRLLDNFEALGMNYELIKTKNQIKQFGKTYHFLTNEAFRGISMPKNYECFQDQL